MKKAIIFLFIICLSFTFSPAAYSQCSMCSINAEMSVKNGNTQGSGLNTGIIYLLAIPYLLITAVGVLWYLKYRKKAVKEAINA